MLECSHHLLLRFENKLISDQNYQEKFLVVRLETLRFNETLIKQISLIFQLQFFDGDNPLVHDYPLSRFGLCYGLIYLSI
jgi:hypothetical protein